ncbi:MAG: hypothetical protein SGJ09_10915 [Phycisphaerae bacterium]|nr:hypothetical protein [Phycisphaerae bacterium]
MRAGIRAGIRAGGTAAAVTFAALAMLSAGCATDPESTQPDGTVELATPPVVSVPTLTPPLGGLAAVYADLVTRQTERLKRLQTIDGYGVIELRYLEDGTEHFDQCDMHLYAFLPSKTALRLTKVGTIAWIGSDAERWWIFRLDTSPKTLEVRPWPESSGGNEPAAVPVDEHTGRSVVSPRTILVLAGLAPLPAASEVTLTDNAGMLVAATKSSRWTIDRSTGLPSTIELLDGSGLAGGRVWVTGTLSEYASAPADDLTPGDYPKVAQRVIVSRADGTGSVKLSFQAVSARPNGVKPRFFDLKDLQLSLRPDETVWVENRRATTGAGAPAPREQR